MVECWSPSVWRHRSRLQAFLTVFSLKLYKTEMIQISKARLPDNYCRKGVFLGNILWMPGFVLLVGMGFCIQDPGHLFKYSVNVTVMKFTIENSTMNCFSWALLAGLPKELAIKFKNGFKRLSLEKLKGPLIARHLGDLVALLSRIKELRASQNQPYNLTVDLH